MRFLGLSYRDRDHFAVFKNTKAREASYTSRVTNKCYFVCCFDKTEAVSKQQQVSYTSKMGSEGKHQLPFKVQAFHEHKDDTYSRSLAH
jgi:hypothetical protein